ncbi:inactive N-acetylated-alpha-linked acidic dipeptidase-like protein 2 isoform X6 [Pezoporus wallicus]|uniref:inactive N-acetylated-alpha-linked acidic dipeptidase-like protein 2 isoform X6 n=1 Tax=Pezoporus wallicus TaxID=35540 RepID=UPI00254BC1BE|nr:inactive N-acetylated-alpha-linked acidic dipeptidase-like protein 2 isoform X6 [Pezoporus wallicus]XP_061308499.1 inactive N-acetylated-alpha-linked acidic dipeptidase-like protein 2 isoform X6 [Pezoporus flaviventris]
MGENESSVPSPSQQDKKMAYHKVNADQRAQGHSPYLDNDELQATALELEWDMEKELEEPGFDHFRLDGAVQHHLGNSQSPDLDLEPIQPSSSPKGRFQRLQEDPDYISHYTRQAPKSNRCSFFQILKVFCTALILFIFGILIGYYARKKCPSPSPSQEPNNAHTYHEILKEIKAEHIQQIYRDLLQFPREDDVDIAMKILVQWSSQGLEDVRLVNYSVLLDLPGSSSNTVTLKNSGECFYPSGQQCNRETKTLHSQDLLYSYAAYSAKGTLEAELVDVQYGTVADLIRIQAITNVTKKIALLKLGQSPLLYKLSLLEDAGFGGVLLYVDPCDLPKTTDLTDKAFMVSLNGGGDPSTPGYASIDGSYRQNRLNLTTLLVQPISAVLAKKLISLPEDTVQKDRCIPLQWPAAGKKIISLNIQSVTTYKTISNVIGYLKGTVFPDRYVIIGSHHNSLNIYSGQEWASSTAIITAFIQALTLKVKKGWRPDRTIVFCSWGGTLFGNIGSYEWAEDFKRVLQRNVVAYLSLHNPVTGNSTLHPVASPSLQQLAAENSSFLSEALFPVHATKTEELDPSFSLHETIAKLTGQVTLQIANEPVLPFNALDIALEVQNSLKGDEADIPQLLAVASRLRDTAELFQSDEMRPANDPKERAPIRVRMLNDVLQSLEKSFLIHRAPPGLYRNILYRLDERTSQFSVLLEALEHCKLHQSNETIQAALSEVLNSINSAQVYFKAGLDVFETTLAGKK